MAAIFQTTYSNAFHWMKIVVFWWKFLRASSKYPTMHHFVTEICTHAHFCYKMLHCGTWDLCIVGFVQLDIWERHIEHCIKSNNGILSPCLFVFEWDLEYQGYYFFNSKIVVYHTPLDVTNAHNWKYDMKSVVNPLRRSDAYMHHWLDNGLSPVRC